MLEYEKNQAWKSQENRNKKLAVMFGWMLSKDRNMEKYAQIYAKHNFDILLVKTHPKQLIFPKNGSIKNAQDVLNFLVKNDKYSNIAIHGFSVGGYQFGEILAKMTQNPEIANKIIPTVKGLLLVCFCKFFSNFLLF